MKIREWVLVAASAAAFGVGGAASAESDDAFARKAASAGKMEVELGRHAVETASSPKVKQFGERMVEAHGQANDRLREVAQQQELELPSELLPEHRQQVERLKALEGSDFDRAYVDAMVKDHEKDLKLFREQAQGGDSAVDRFAEQQTPILERHLEQARDLQQQLQAQRSDTGGATPAALPREPGEAPRGADPAGNPR